MTFNQARNVILQATLDTIAEYSISKTTMRLIADKAGMKQPNLHYYFDTKEELLLQLMEWMQEHYDAWMDENVLCKESFDEKMAGFFAQEQYTMEHNPEFTKVSIDLWGLGQHDPSVNRAYAHTYGCWRERISSTISEAMPELSKEKCELTAVMVVSMLMGVAIQWLNNPKAFDLQQYIDYCLKTVLLTLEDEKEKKGQ